MRKPLIPLCFPKISINLCTCNLKKQIEIKLLHSGVTNSGSTFD
ncbi:MAG: hypothetical protein P8X74_16065 [Reinekea sp.]